MAYIIQQVAGDQQLMLANEELLWRFGFGTSWNYLRVCVRCSFQMTSTVSSLGFMVGVNNGTAAGYFSPGGCTEYMGIAANAGGWTFHAGSPNYFSWAPATSYYKVGTTVANSANASFLVYGPTSPGRTLFFYDFEKRTAANQMTVVVTAAIGAYQTTDFTSMTEAYLLMDNYQNPAAYDAGFQAMTLNLTYPYGYTFDSLSIGNSSTNSTVVISDVLVARYF